MPFGRNKVTTGIYSAVITARSSEEPGRDMTYTVLVETGGGLLEFEGVAPHPLRRWSTPFETLNLVPFEVTTRVEVHIVATGSTMEAFITTSELPDAGACP
jgi:hypothetical protein